MATYDEAVALLADPDNAVEPGPGKFEGTTDRRIAELLNQLSLEGQTDQDFGVADEGGWYGLMGRFVVWNDSQGFFGYDHFDSDKEASEAFSQMRGQWA